MDRLLGMEIFLQAAERGSFSSAAQALKVSPGLVTKHIKSLEDHLGVDLFHRTTRRISLTEAGTILFTRWQKILSDIGEAEAAVGSEQLKVRGTLRISTPAAFGRLKIAPLVAEFAKLYPDLVVELLFNNNHFNPIAEGIDVTFLMSTLTDHDASNLVVRRIETYGTVVCAAPTYLARHGQPMGVHELTQHNCLGHRNEATAGINPWRFQGPSGVIAMAVQGSYLANNTDALIAAAVHGHGLICVPRLMVDAKIEAEHLVPLVLDYRPVDQPVYAYWAANRNLSARVRKFIDFTVAHLTEHGPAA